MASTRYLLVNLALTIAIGTVAAPLHAGDATPPNPAATKPASTVQRVDVEGFDKARQAKDAVVIDVRSPEEFAAGHVPGAVNIPVTGKGSVGFDEKVSAAAKGKQPLVHCRSGVRSAKAVERMQKLGIVGVVECPAGWVGWSGAGKPVEKGPADRPSK